MDCRAYAAGAELTFYRRATPTDEALVESISGQLRQEFINEYWLL